MAAGWSPEGSKSETTSNLPVLGVMSLRTRTSTTVRGGYDNCARCGQTRVVAIEFLDPDGQVEGEIAPVEAIGGDGPQRRRLEIERDVVAAFVLLAGAAVLAVVASFQTVMTEYQRRGGHPVGASVDAWGRYHTIGTASVAPGVHEARYGIPICCAAGVFALAALLVGVSALRKRNTRHVAIATVAVATAICLLAGVTATMWLQIDATFDSFHATTNGADDLSDAFGGFHLGIGAAIWTALAAIVAALLASYASLRVRARWSEVGLTG